MIQATAGEDILVKEKELFQRKQFWAILAIVIVTAVIFLIAAYTNKELVDFQRKYGGVNLGILTLMLALWVIMTTYIAEKSHKKGEVSFWALIIYCIVLIIFSGTLFHSRINRNPALLFSIVLIGASLWFCWTSYHVQKDANASQANLGITIMISFFLIAMSFYFLYYSYSASRHPWIL